ncbi:ATP-binding protein [Streptomyces mayteni]
MINRLMTHHWHILTLPSGSAAVSLARTTAEMVYPSWGIKPSHPVMDPALLILSELVTNSVRHAASASPNLDIVYSTAPGVLAFAVHDQHPHHPDLTAQPDTLGKGLALVLQTTVELGGSAGLQPDEDGRGKSVLIALPVTEGHSLGADDRMP